MPNTAGSGYEYFKRYFFPQADKEAIIVDERFNGGGQVADYYIEMLRRPLVSYWATRYGETLRTPNAAILGPKVMIIDETAGSGGDLLPWMFRKFGLGKLVGKRTWGGLVGILGFPTLMDGGLVTAPDLAIFTEDGWVVENVGVAAGHRRRAGSGRRGRGQGPAARPGHRGRAEGAGREPAADAAGPSAVPRPGSDSRPSGRRAMRPTPAVVIRGVGFPASDRLRGLLLQRILDPSLIARYAEMQDHSAIDLVSGLLGVEAARLRDEAADLGTDIEGEVFRGKDRRPWVGDCEDRDDIKVAPAGMEFLTTATALQSRRTGIVRRWRIGRHGGVSRWDWTADGPDERRSWTPVGRMPPGGTGLAFDTIILVVNEKQSPPGDFVFRRPARRLDEGVISVQAAKMAIFLSLAVATALGSWYLHVRIPEGQWRRPHEAGRASMSRGQFGEAEREFATAVELAKSLGENDPREALSLFHQADALVAQNRLDDAIRLFERALEIDEKALGPDHPDVAPVLEHYAVPLRRMGRTAQAEAAENRVRIIRARSARGRKRNVDRKRSVENGLPGDEIDGG